MRSRRPGQLPFALVLLAAVSAAAMFLLALLMAASGAADALVESIARVATLLLVLPPVVYTLQRLGLRGDSG